MLNTPILLITFNRPKHTRKVLERIVEAKPKDLYVFRDHWRDDRADEPAKCEQVIEVVKELTDDTGINVRYLLPDTNLGCGAGPMIGISWFFDNVEQGIVMEDDCLAHPDFFPFCEELLNRYGPHPQAPSPEDEGDARIEKQERVAFINSTLYDDRWTKALGDEAMMRGEKMYSYGFSRYMVTGAWAAYRETWKGFDLNLQDMDVRSFRRHVNLLTGNKTEADWWYYKVKQIQMDRSKKSYWDYQMQIFLFQQSAVTIHPRRNLISNIGFDEEGTHTFVNNGMGDRPVYPIMPLVHPADISIDTDRDKVCWAKSKSHGRWHDFVGNIYKSMLFSSGFGHWVLETYKRMRGKKLVMPAV